MQGHDFLVRFWGVRGSIAAPGPATARYGGNTSSIEVRCGERLILLDGGTGMRTLGNGLIAEAEDGVAAEKVDSHTLDRRDVDERLTELRVR